MKFLLFACLSTWSIYAMDSMAWYSLCAGGVDGVVACKSRPAVVQQKRYDNYGRLTEVLGDIFRRCLTEESANVGMNACTYESRMRQINRGFFPFQQAVSREIAYLLLSNLPRMSVTDVGRCAVEFFTRVQIYSFSVQKVAEAVLNYANEMGIKSGAKELADQLSTCSDKLKRGTLAELG